MAERFLYLPAIAFAACLVEAVYAIPWPNPKAAPMALCLIAALFAIRTWVRNQDWQDDLTLARATASASPESYKGHALLATALYVRSGIRQARRLSEAGRDSPAPPRAF